MESAAHNSLRTKDEQKSDLIANLDFEARVPVPFSIFPSTYRDHESQTQTTTTTQVHEEVEIKPQPPKAGREGQYSSYTATAEVVPPREEHHHSEEEVRITREEERHHRPGVQHEEYHHEEKHQIRDERRPEPASQYTTSHAHVEIDTRHPYYSTPIDIAERQYRQRFRPSQQANYSVDPPSRPQYQASDTFKVNNYTVEGRPAPSQYKTTEKTEINNFTVEGSRPQPQYFASEKTEINNFTVDPRAPSQPNYRQSTKVNNFTVDAPVSRPSYKTDVKISEETVEPAKFSRPQQKNKMGYYDEDGHYHSFRQGAHKLADKIAHPRGHEHVEVDIVRESGRSAGGPSGENYLPNTVTIPCHHIRLGDFLMLQGRPCQVIRISTSSATGQYRYLGVDLFTKQLHEESSFISNPAPSVVVQTMLGPVFKQYRVLDMQEGHIVAMTETGDVKQGLPVIDQSNLYTRLNNAFESGRGSLRVLVLNDGGRELAVDMKVIHGSRL
ncbi:hypothetical protein QQZ08_006991 [Neonectria magnoliae]|uniref:Translation initiation factor 5A-like N-terminal domain-containing protein n=1 Tax=Neonectria magnoliae TaxID=2732573 RepID=A0ABR1I0N2_9HYPO